MSTKVSFQILLMGLYVIMFGVMSTSVSGQCQIDQQSILIRLKKELHFSSSLSTKLVSWDPNVTDCCTWVGVNCSIGGEVIGLDLSNETISAGIDGSSALFGLKNLETLNLAGNYFNFTPIPSGFGSLISLRNLNLSNSWFAGQIPGELSQLTNLQVLDLSSLFSGIRSLKLENPNLGMLVRNLTQLRVLALDSVNISAQKSDWCQALSSSLLHLEVLSLSGCQLSGPLDDSLGKLKSLSVIRLAQNNLNTSVPDFFGDFRNLTVLYLSACNLGGTFPTEVLQMQNLQILDLSSNMNLHGSLSDFPVNGSLRSLVLSNTNLSGPIPESIGNLKSLSRIELPYSNFSGLIPKSMANLTQLLYLDLSSNNFTGQIPSFQLCKKLTHIDLSRNSLSGIIPFAHFQDLQNLVSVNVRFNAFNGSIPSSLFIPPQLQKIQLSNLSDMIEFQNFQSLSNLTTLDLSFNNFTGQIPSFQLCKNITHIDLSCNSLSGTIPSSHFQNLQNLVSVNLGFNAFNGSIPSSLFNLPQLQKIQLSNNRFDGVIANVSDPSASSLDTLDLSSNKLEGQIPKFIFQLGGLIILSLSTNNLSGMIEFKDFQGLWNLTAIDLSFNSLTIITSGVFSPQLPKFFSLRLASCNLQKFPNLRNQTRLQFLDLSDNKITGEIPNWVWEVGNGYRGLRYLNLSRNQLTGFQEPYFIPPIFVLDLHSNFLSGVIPVPPKMAFFIDYSNNRFNSSLPENIGGNLTFAYFFSVSNNLLTGQIPDTLCNTTYIEVLDLSNNQLTGSIPRCLIEYGDSLGVLNLGNNHLSGGIGGIFPSTCGLNNLDLHGNYLEGEIPPSLVNCTKLEVLNLSKNRITDTYPCFLRNITSLRVLVLRSNMFHGSVRCGPQQHNRWSKIQILDIAHNNFNGALPADYFWQWDAMIDHDDGEQSSNKHLSFTLLQFNNLYYQDTVTVTIKGLELELVKILIVFTSIDISSNRFSGEIPDTIGRLTALYSLNVSHNEFTGSLPPSFGNLSQLESLDMSSNKITGEVPWVLTTLTFLSVLNLSYNELEGRIPTGSQFQTFTETSYTGNKGLCGVPLNKTCISSVAVASTPNSEESDDGFEWQSILYGMPVGFLIAILYSLFKRGTSRHSNLSRPSAGNGYPLYMLLFLRRW